MSTHTKKKILFLITKSNWGGAQRYVYDVATALDRDVFEVVVALGGDGALESMLQASGIKTISIAGLQRDISLYQELRASLTIARIIRHEDPDILHVNSSKAGGVGAFIGRILFVPRIIFTAHGWAFNEDRPWWQRLLIKSLHWWTVLFAHRTIAVSHGLKVQLDWPFVDEKMVVINPGRTIDAPLTRSDARSQIAAFVPALNAYNTDVWVGTIAELHPIKRLPVAIEAVKNLVREYPRLRYVIIGDGQLREKLETLIVEHNLHEHVFLTGPIPEAGRLLSAMDMFILPSRSESYGYVLLEAGIAGLPTIATNVGGIPDIITDREHGLLIPPDNSAELTSAIRLLLTHPEQAAKLSAALKQKTNSLSVQEMTRKTMLVYEGNTSLT